ncbi:hypothetical protein [Streptomyces regalis]|nr:hypothetical protein [Streptomyces regalis]
MTETAQKPQTNAAVIDHYVTLFDRLAHDPKALDQGCGRRPSCGRHSAKR